MPSVMILLKKIEMTVTILRSGIMDELSWKEEQKEEKEE